MIMKIIKKIFSKNVQALATTRSGKWPKLRKKHLESNYYCRACGSRNNLIPHHIIPVHIDPSLELDPNNLITLCEEKNFNCHLFFGHLRDWRLYNESVVEDSKNWFEKINKTKGI